jgi:hypothetical protein
MDMAEGSPEEALPIDDEIEALLGFEPVPRKVKRKNGWFPHLQREFIHRLALCGSPADAARQMHKNVSGIEALLLLYKLQCAPVSFLPHPQRSNKRLLRDADRAILPHPRPLWQSASGTPRHWRLRLQQVLLPRLPLGIPRIPGRLQLRLALRRRLGRLGRLRRRVRRCRFVGRLAVGLFRRGLLGLRSGALLAGGDALGGLALVDRGAGAILLERLVPRLGGLGGAVLERVLVGHGCGAFGVGAVR